MAAAHPVLEAFPKRPVRVLRSPLMSPLGVVVLVLVLAFFACLFPGLEGSGLMRDWKISGAPVAVRDADITDGRCTTRFVLVDCSAKLSYRVAGVTYRSEPSLMFFSFDGYDRAAAVRSRDNPELATLDIGLQELWNRTITLAALFAGLGALAIFGLTLLPESRRWRQLVKTQANVNVVPTIVEITGNRTSYGKTSYYIRYEAANGRKRRAQIGMGKEKPFVVGADGKRALALGVFAVPGGRPLLLNENLTAVELSDDERNALWAARNALA